MKKAVINSYKSIRYTVLFLLFLLAFGGQFIFAGEPNHASHEEGHASAGNHSACEPHNEEIADIILHHVQDNHDWHLTDWPTGDGCYMAIGLPLPWLLYNNHDGIRFFTSTHALNEDPNYIADSHGHIHYVTSKKKVDISVHDAEKDTTGHYAVVGHGSHLEVFEFEPDHEAMVLDFSMTKTALHILIVCLLMFWIFTRVAKGYKTNEGKAPKGVQSFMEPLILFVKDEISDPFLGKKSLKYLPYLLTLFFFIWIANLFGLTPLSSNIAGNTSVTAALALLTFILILANTTKDFWVHIFWFPGVPLPVKFLMMPVEILGLFTKPFALAIRLFANISAGHFMVLSLICLVFILGNNGESVAGAVGISPLSIAFTLFIFTVEMIVAAVQAFVFTMLTAVFIGQAMETHDHHEEHEAAHH